MSGKVTESWIDKNKIFNKEKESKYDKRFFI